MHPLRNLCIAIAVTIGVVGGAGPARADNVPGQGSGYFGSAEYQSGFEQLVGPYDNWTDCNDALTAAIDNATINFGETLVAVDGCGYSFGIGHPVDNNIHLLVAAESPKESAEIGKLLLGEVGLARSRYRVDDYEAQLRAIVKASGGK
jgi:hypothetical protein